MGFFIIFFYSNFYTTNVLIITSLINRDLLHSWGVSAALLRRERSFNNFICLNLQRFLMKFFIFFIKFIFCLKFAAFFSYVFLLRWNAAVFCYLTFFFWYDGITCVWLGFLFFLNAALEVKCHCDQFLSWNDKNCSLS